MWAGKRIRKVDYQPVGACQDLRLWRKPAARLNLNLDVVFIAQDVNGAEGNLSGGREPETGAHNHREKRARAYSRDSVHMHPMPGRFRSSSMILTNDDGL